MREESISEKKIQRVRQVSLINGWSIAGFAGLCALLVLIIGDWYGFAVGVAVALGGLMELRGNRLLGRRMPQAFHWLAGSQLYLMLVLWIYCYSNIVRFDPEDPWSRFSPFFKELVLRINQDTYLVEEMLKLSYYATYISVIVAVLIYQGGLCFFYLARKKYLYAGTQ